MIDYIKGDIAELSPTHVTLENSGIGYYVHITLSTYTQLSNNKNAKLFVYEAIREDAHLLYGFMEQSEREVFLHLISVSGVGANTARMIMSSLSVAEIQEIILSGNANALKSVKGIGQKTAERVIVDLKDKIGKMELESSGVLFAKDSAVKTEAVSALVMLGFSQPASKKAVDKILKESPSLSVEIVIKQALKMI